MTKPSARVLCDSVSPTGARLTTLEVVMHRFVLAELNTHRVFSRNSASSRAVPVQRMIQRVREDPALPLVWGSEQRGMQAGDELEGEARTVVENAFQEYALEAASHAEFLAREGLHKSLINRLLEPFLWHTVIVTATEWEGFWKQRCSPLAEPHICAAAEAMQKAYVTSVPDEVSYGEWHLPLVRQEDRDQPVLNALRREYDLDSSSQVLKRISAARCARVSYLTHDGKRDLTKDLDLARRLIGADPPHASPFEHVATPTRFARPGNLRGWAQYRHQLWPDY